MFFKCTAKCILREVNLDRSKLRVQEYGRWSVYASIMRTCQIKLTELSDPPNKILLVEI